MKESVENNKSYNVGQGRVKKIKRTWDFLCVSSDGKVIHFSKISKKISAIGFLALFILIYGAALTYFFLNQKNELNMFTAKFIDLESRFQDVSRERDEFAGKLALAEKSSSNTIEKVKNNEQPVPKPQKIEQEDSKQAPASDENKDTSGLSIEEYSAKRAKGSSVNLRLKIKTAAGEQNQVKGYIFSALMSSLDSDPSSWKLFPEVRLKDGIPEFPEKGQSFSVKGQKEVTIRLKANDSLKAVKVFVFDEAKKVFIEKVFQIDDSPRKEKKKSRRK